MLRHLQPIQCPGWAPVPAVRTNIYLCAKRGSCVLEWNIPQKYVISHFCCLLLIKFLTLYSPLIPFLILVKYSSNLLNEFGGAQRIKKTMSVFCKTENAEQRQLTRLPCPWLKCHCHYFCCCCQRIFVDVVTMVRAAFYHASPKL